MGAGPPFKTQRDGGSTGWSHSPESWGFSDLIPHPFPWVAHGGGGQLLVTPTHLLGGPGRPGRGQPVLAVVVGQRDHPPEAPSQERMEGLLKAAWRPWKQDEEWRGIIFKWGELPESQAACKGGLYYAKLNQMKKNIFHMQVKYLFN